MLMKRRLGNDDSDSRSVGASAEDVLVEVLMERNVSATTDTSNTEPQGIVSASPSEELDQESETMYSRTVQDSLSDLEGQDLTDDELYDILLEIEEELRVDGTYAYIYTFSFAAQAHICISDMTQLRRRGAVGGSVGRRAHVTRMSSQ